MANVEEVTPQLASVQLSGQKKVIFKYDDVNIKLPFFDLVNPLIDEKKDVVLFGDDNSTLSVALAALRQSWNGIKVCIPEHVSKYRDEYCIATTAKFTCIDYCIQNGEKMRVDDATTVKTIKQILCLPTIPPKETYLFNVLPASIPNEVSFQKKIVWYQMPWETTKRHGKGTDLLIEQFLNELAPKQDVGDHLLIGVTNMFPYVRAYNVPKLLSFTNGYRLVGATKNLTVRLLKYGYMKEGDNDLHNSVLDYHATLVFERK